MEVMTYWLQCQSMGTFFCITKLTLSGVIEEWVENFDSSCLLLLLPGHKPEINKSHGDKIAISGQTKNAK